MIAIVHIWQQARSNFPVFGVAFALRNFSKMLGWTLHDDFICVSDLGWSFSLLECDLKWLQWIFDESWGRFLAKKVSKDRLDLSGVAVNPGGVDSYASSSLWRSKSLLKEPEFEVAKNLNIPEQVINFSLGLVLTGGTHTQERRGRSNLSVHDGVDCIRCLCPVDDVMHSSWKCPVLETGRTGGNTACISSAK